MSEDSSKKSHLNPLFQNNKSSKGRKKQRFFIP